MDQCACLGTYLELIILFCRHRECCCNQEDNVQQEVFPDTVLKRWRHRPTNQTKMQLVTFNQLNIWVHTSTTLNVFASMLPASKTRSMEKWHKNTVCEPWMFLKQQTGFIPEIQCFGIVFHMVPAIHLLVLLWLALFCWNIYRISTPPFDIVVCILYSNGPVIHWTSYQWVFWQNVTFCGKNTWLIQEWFYRHLMVRKKAA